MTDKMNGLEKIVVFSGTGEQAGSVVRHLSALGGYKITVPTRDPTSAHAQVVASLANVQLIKANYETEEGLRNSFREQDACYFLLNSFSMRESEEYFWTFRAYEIAVQSGLKLFIYSGSRSRHRALGYGEPYRNSHNIVKANISDWLFRQDTGVLPWTIVSGGVYAEMLNSLLRPVRMGPNLVFAAPVTDESVIPLVPVAHYGNAVEWALQNPIECRGTFVQAPVFQVTWSEIAQAYQTATGEPSTFAAITQDQWFEGASKEVNPEMTLPPTATPGDPIAFTFRKSFSGWWNLWKDGRRSKELESTPVPSTYKSLADWMEKSKYRAA